MKRKYISIFVIITLGSIIVIFGVKNKYIKKDENKKNVNYQIQDKEECSNVNLINFSDKNYSNTENKLTGKTDNNIEKNEYKTTHEEMGIDSNNIMPAFFFAKNTDELLNWIKNADNDDVRKHFLDVARQKNKIIIIELKNNKYILQSIKVHPNHEYMTYTFRNDLKYIDVTINLSNSMKMQMVESSFDDSIENVVLQYNKKLKNDYKDFKLEKDKVKILGNKINLFYNDGGYYTKNNGQLKLIAPSAFFEFESTEIKINLYGTLKTKRWNNNYIDLFNFKIIEL